MLEADIDKEAFVLSPAGKYREKIRKYRAFISLFKSG